MSAFSQLHPVHTTNKLIISLYITVLCLVLTIAGIYFFGEYGVALFFLIPFFSGLATAILLNRKAAYTAKDTIAGGITTMGFLLLSLLFFAIEGLICMVMALPLILPLNCLGSYTGYKISRSGKNKNELPAVILFFAIPLVSFIEKEYLPASQSVITSIEIKASPETVWKNVIRFPPLKAPSEFIFKTGISYPVDATIDGEGAGAVRYCNFTTGSFVEPITRWEAPALLQFDVLQQPAPMTELNFWDIDAPHLHDYFVSQKGQFRLIPLANGHTLLEGTTWYYHRIRPAAYWKLWSEYIIHKIHLRVLDHIREISEQESATQAS